MFVLIVGFSLRRSVLHLSQKAGWLVVGNQALWQARLREEREARDDMLVPNPPGARN